ncbi:MAG: A/G-specific adenine glycosylase [Vampirovibrio sp.]|nr:A/G-specific adenine glycosylase [Vampirovibrio sp.]
MPATKAKPTQKSETKQGFADELVTWYIANHRDLPWRDTKNPYHIWLSEIMLQQTQVATVIPYYHRFLDLFPTIQDLAAAPQDQVLKAWEGLGYYARCRNLYKAAQQIVSEHKGVFPKVFEDVHALCGIGRSTAGAIVTFAFDDPHPLMDGNVKRVLCRLYNISEDPGLPTVQTTLWEYSEALLTQTDDAYSYNQAIMELGATLCTTKNPKCLVCPVQSHCSGFAAGTQHELPTKPPKKQTPHLTIGVGVIWHNHKILIQQRPEEGLLGGLWEFPGGKQEADESLEETVAREIKEELGIDVEVQEKIMAVKHAYTHFKITLHAYHCKHKSGKPVSAQKQPWQWVPLEEIPNYAFPKANKKVLEHLLQAKSE